VRADDYPCPCCGYLTFSEPPGSYDLCPICFWEDDAVQLRWPDWAGGANRPSLIDAQLIFQRLGAMEERFLRNVRPPRPDDTRDPEWRLFDPSRDHIEPRKQGERTPWPEDSTALYYWRTVPELEAR
jgi:hypothetical protein